jgi:drug/metabolite transporter (DMT)-like permease
VPAPASSPIPAAAQRLDAPAALAPEHYRDLLDSLAQIIDPRHRHGRRHALATVLVGVLDTSANLLFADASTRGNLGVVGVLSSLYPVVTVVLARLVLAERLSWSQSAGVAVALLGVGLLATG